MFQAVHSQLIPLMGYVRSYSLQVGAYFTCLSIMAHGATGTCFCVSHLQHTSYHQNKYTMKGMVFHI